MYDLFTFHLQVLDIVTKCFQSSMHEQYIHVRGTLAVFR